MNFLEHQMSNTNTTNYNLESPLFKSIENPFLQNKENYSHFANNENFIEKPQQTSKFKEYLKNTKSQKENSSLTLEEEISIKKESSVKPKKQSKSLEKSKKKEAVVFLTITHLKRMKRLLEEI